MRYAVGPCYRDWPGCLKRYDWVVKDGLRDPFKMFNMTDANMLNVCKVCGGKTKNGELALHVQEHAAQLGLVKVVEMTAEQARLLGDVEAVVEGTMESWHADEDGSSCVEFEAPDDLTAWLVSAIVGGIQEQDVDYVLCKSCQS